MDTEVCSEHWVHRCFAMRAKYGDVNHAYIERASVTVLGNSTNDDDIGNIKI